METTSAVPPESVILSPLSTSPPVNRYMSLPPPPTRTSAPSPPSIVSFPSPALIVVARLGAVIVSFPVVPLIVIVSVPLVKLVAVKLVKSAVSPLPTLIIRFDTVPDDVSVRTSPSPVN